MKLFLPSYLYTGHSQKFCFSAALVHKFLPLLCSNWRGMDCVPTADVHESSTCPYTVAQVSKLDFISIKLSRSRQKWFLQEQKHRISCVRRDPQESLSPTPGSTQDHPKSMCMYIIHPRKTVSVETAIKSVIFQCGLIL